jgi:hypothetical protein
MVMKNIKMKAIDSLMSKIDDEESEGLPMEHGLTLVIGTGKTSKSAPEVEEEDDGESEDCMEEGSDGIDGAMLELVKKFKAKR